MGNGTGIRPESVRYKLPFIEEVSEVMSTQVITFPSKEIYNEGLEQGIEQGKEQGSKLRDREMICAMLQKGKKPEEIADFCDYPMKLILDVQKDMPVMVEEVE